MNKPVAITSLLALGLAGFVAGRYSRPSTAAPAATSKRILYYVDPMHPSYHSDKPGIAPDCGMALEPVYAEEVRTSASSAALPAGVVGIDGTMQQLVGIGTAKVERSNAPGKIRVLGRVAPEDTLVYRVDSGADGFVRETYNDSVGTLVKKDQKLAAFYGPDYLAVASGYLAATAGVPGSAVKDGSRTVAYPGAVSKQGFSSIQGYTDRLRNLGMSEMQIKEMAEKRQLPETIDIVSPANGLILSRNVTPGQHFERSTEFYRIADLSRVWIVADVFGNDAQRIRPGTIAHVTLADQSRTFAARVSSVLPEVDPTTRTLKLRLEADNPGLILRPEMFVDVELSVEMPAGLTVPADAVIDSGREQCVFVERADGTFEPRTVQTGWHFGDRVQIREGLAEGERVVASGAFLVDSESRLKSVAQAPTLEQPRHGMPPGSHSESGMALKTAKVMDLEHDLAPSPSEHRQ